MLVVNFIRQNGLQSLIDQYKIDIKYCTTNSNLVLLKYNQVESPIGEKIAQECRALILDSTNDWVIVSRAFDKFFNYGEGHAANINWQTARVYEKLDGSLMSLYWYKDKWNVATSGTPNALCEVPFGHLTFQELFWNTWNDMQLKLPDERDRDKTFVFELTSPMNRVVVQHKEAKLHLIGVRNLKTQLEYFPEEFIKPYDWPCVQAHSLASIDDVLKAAEKINPISNEGFVVVDAGFNRIKVKSPQYVALHHVVSHTSEKSLLEIVRTNEFAEFLNYYPEYKKQFDQIKEKYDELTVIIEHDYERIKNLTVQKDFALQAVKTICPAALFTIRKGDCNTVKEFLARMRVDHLLEILNKAKK